MILSESQISIISSLWREGMNPQQIAVKTGSPVAKVIKFMKVNCLID
jgi:hypothetical protein